MGDRSHDSAHESNARNMGVNVNKTVCDYCGKTADADVDIAERTLDGMHNAIGMRVTFSNGDVCSACRIAADSGAVAELYKRHAPSKRTARKIAAKSETAASKDAYPTARKRAEKTTSKTSAKM